MGIGSSLLYLLPALLLLLVLALRRYPGERTLLAFADRRRDRPKPTGGEVPVPQQRPRALVPRGGRLIASSLAVRPPPARVPVPIT